MDVPRKSVVLPHRAAANLTRAVSFADEIGRGLRVAVDLNYALTGCPEEDMTVAFRRLLKSFFVKWHNRHPALSNPRAASYVWVAEGLPNKYGIHWLLSLPNGTLDEFKGRLPVWLERTAGPILTKDAIMVQPAYNPRGKADYMLKGLAEAHARRFGVNWSAQGIVYGKRCGISENLGPKAIARHRALDGQATQATIRGAPSVV